MNSFYSLDLFQVVGDVNENTPYCVFLQIFKSFGYDIDIGLLNNSLITKLLKEIRTKKIVSIQDVTRENAIEVAQMINRDEHWDFKKLKEAFNHLKKYYLVFKPEIPVLDFSIGMKTNDDPLNYDSCILYRICSYYGLSLTSSTTLEDMYIMVRLLNENVENLKSSLQKNIDSMNKNKLISVIVSMKKENFTNINPIILLEKKECLENVSNSDKIDLTKLSEVCDKIKNYNYLAYRHEPKNYEESIILSAIIFGINLIDAINPTEQYQHIKHCFLRNIQYEPINDDLFHKKYKINKNHYDVTKTWNPYLTSIYDSTQIEKFARFEGYSTLHLSEGEIMTYNGFLQLMNVSNTFYHGINPNMIKTLDQIITVEIDIDTIENYSYDELISYGIESEGKFFVFNIATLTEYFEHEQMFKNPLDVKEIFTDESILKLKYICFQIIGNNSDQLCEEEYNSIISYVSSINMGENDIINDIIKESRYIERINKSKKSSIIEKYTKLLKTIENIEKNISYVNEYDKKLKYYYTHGYKETITTFLNYILELGYYFRGWKVEKVDKSIDKEILPINSLNSYISESNFDQIEQNSIEHLLKINTFLNGLNSDTVKIIKQIPLIHISKNGSNIIFLHNKRVNQGLTVVDRINICVENKDINSCMRTSSNYFLSTAYYYMSILGLNKPFNIKDFIDVF